MRRLDTGASGKGWTAISCAEPAWPHPPRSSTEEDADPTLPPAACSLYFGKNETPKHKKNKTNQTASGKQSKLQDQEEKEVQPSPGRPSRSPGRPAAVLDTQPQRGPSPQGWLSGLSATLASKVKGVSPGRRGHWRRHCSLVPDVIVWLTAPQPGLAQTGLQGVTPHPRPSTGRRVRTCPRVGTPGPGASFPQGLSQQQRAGPGWRGQDPTPGRSAKAAGDVFAGWPSRASPTRPGALPVSV